MTNRALSLLLLLTFSTGALAQPAAPVIAEISPDSGPAAGGTEVVITGENFTPAIQCLLPCPTVVRFGEVTVPVNEESNDRLVVVTPSHVPGAVDVTIDVPGREPATKTDGFTFIGGAEAQYELVLFPVYLDDVIDGAFGTRWMTDLWIRNGGGEAVWLAPWPCLGPNPCPAVFPLTYSLQSGFSLHNLPPFLEDPDGNPSRLLFVQKPGATAVSFGLRFADLSRQELNAGTDLPVIRESELIVARDAQLLNVPMADSRFRVLLRVYDTAYSTSDFRVTIFPQTEDADAQIHSVELRASTPQTDEFRTQAAYAQLDITDLLRLEKEWPAIVRIAVEPLTPGSRYWAFASVTNNDTQLVTLVTPQ